MLLLEPLFVCLVGAGAAALVIITAPAWTAAAARLSEWFLRALTRASRTVNRSLNDQDENVVDGWVVDSTAKNHEDRSSDEPTQAEDKEANP